MFSSFQVGVWNKALQTVWLVGPVAWTDCTVLTDCAVHNFTATDSVHRACAADKERELGFAEHCITYPLITRVLEQIS